MIVLHHLLVHGLKLYEVETLTPQTIFSLFTNSIVIIGVNVFVILSGYFGIKFKIETILKLVLQALFYSLCIYMLSLLISPQPFNIKTLMAAIFPVSSGLWWFLSAYVALVIIAPVLNLGIKNLNKTTFTYCVTGLIFLDCFSGFIFKQYSGAGFTLVHMISLYILSRYLRKYNIQLKHAPIVWVISSTIVFFSVILLKVLGIKNGLGRIFQYNNLFIIISSLAFFYIFKSISLKSIKINNLSKLVFGIYLIHDHPYTRGLLSQWVNHINKNYHSFEFLIFFSLSFVLTLILCASLERLRQKGFNKYLWPRLNPYIKKLDSKLN